MAVGFRYKNIELSELQNGDVILTDADGSSHTFTYNSGSYIAPPGIYLTLHKDGPGNFTITDKQRNTYVYQNFKPYQYYDLNGNITNFIYGYYGELYKITDPDPSNREMRYGSYISRQVAYVADPNNRYYNFSYSDDRLCQITDPDNKSVIFSYDANNRLRSFTDPLGRVTTFSLDSNGKVLSYTDARSTQGNPYTTSFTQTTQGSSIITTMTDPGGRTYTYYHDSATGNLTQYKDMLNHAWQYQWTNNDLTKITDPRNQYYTTTNVYDNGNVTRKTVSDGNPNRDIQEDMRYDINSRLNEMLDGERRYTAFKNDNRGNLLSTFNPELKESNGKKYASSSSRSFSIFRGG